MQNDPSRPRSNDPLWMRVGVFAFGLFVLAFLTVIDRPHWFHIRPATGTAVALSAASTTTTATADSPQP